MLALYLILFCVFDHFVSTSDLKGAATSRSVAAPVRVGPAPAVRLTSDGNPLGGLPFYVNPSSKARAAKLPA